MSRLEICPINRGTCGKKIDPKQNQVFIIMPFGEDYAPQRLHYDVFKKIPEWQAVRVDENYDIPDGLCAICHDIQESAVVIVDLSTLNHNVFLELGMAIGMGIPYVLLTQDYKELKSVFDILRVIRYERSDIDTSLVENLVNKLLKRLESINTSVVEVIDEVEEELEIGGKVAYLEAIEKSKIDNAFKLLAKHNQVVLSGKSISVRHAGTAKVSITMTLLLSHPKSKSIEEISKETSLTSNNIRVTCERHKNLIKQYKGMVNLTPDGLAWILDFIEKNSSKIKEQRCFIFNMEPYQL